MNTHKDSHTASASGPNADRGASARAQPMAVDNVTLWIDEELFDPPPDVQLGRGRGRPPVYSDPLIQALLALGQLFGLPLRTLQELAQSLRKLVWPALPVPNYTTLCRRAQTRQALPPVPPGGEPLHLTADSSGLQLYGERQWNRLQKNGPLARRGWRKVQLVLDPGSGRIRALP